MTFKSGPSWVSLAQDGTHSHVYNLSAQPRGAGVSEFTVTVSITYTLFTHITKDFSFKIDVSS